MSEWRRRAMRGLSPGMTFTFVRTFTQRDVEVFGDITRDYNPVHYEERFAQVKGFSGLICHGLLVGSMVCELGGQVGWLASGMEFRFFRPVYIGDTITCRITIEEVDQRNFATAEGTFTNQDGQKVLEATLTGFIPGPREREVLAKMKAEGDPTNKLRRD
ncbi:MAG: MaoC family dehydratase [Thermodesulfobacteriota bacterium]